ncbi:hypothetical protein FQ087_11975 [Sporosarcina sp. ANT_H38]|uniref:NEAT domain-containing protein n=1 Tax=Sporosarcina sp. ANT_H38 TaxID=2597358 RepID=UPI0011F31BD5|nr:NEAT domain-containing protein [Sporosarcina sp. ANT_H38]KAA0966896.1 hypothetical protein FQ087_11975 [Sporosarcina sp. ANT_H38]
MKKQIMMLFSILLVLFTVLPASQIEAAEVTTPVKQEFELPLDVLQVENDDKSAAAQYVKSPAKIVVEDGKTFAYVTLLSSKWWQSLKVQTKQPGTFTDAEVISEDTKADTRVVKFEVQDLSKELNAKIHIIVTGVPGLGEYDHSYDIRLKFDSSKIPVTPEVPVTPAPEVIKDGAYTIDFKALHEEEDKASSMTRYIETPAKLSVKGGKNLVTMTLTNNEQITAFQVEQGGKFVDTTVVKTDVEANKRVVEFEVADLSTIIKAKFTVFVAAANHTGNYNVRLAFDKESVKAVEEVPGEEVETPEEVVAFTDIANTWAKPYIESLASKQIVKGKTATTFAPNDKITRGQFAIILSRALELPKQDFQGTFSDVTKKMDWISFEAASRAGIIIVNDGKFRPNQPITRQQMATMIVRAIEYKDASVLEGVTNKVAFADAKDITAYAKTSVDLATGLGIIGGKVVNGKNVFEPKANATRAHASKMVYYMLEKLQK